MSHMRRRIHVIIYCAIGAFASNCPLPELCHMRRRIHVIRGGSYMSHEEEDTCHMRRRLHVIVRSRIHVI